MALRYTCLMADIGILGGTFDPPHNGHLVLARVARQQLGLERVLWVLTPAPPHKRNQVITPLEHRLAMVQLAIQDEPAFVLSRVDIDRPAPHYAVDTVRLLAQQYPGAGLVYIMGGDSLHDLPYWYRAAEFVARCHRLAVLPRPGIAIDLLALEQWLPEIGRKACFLDAPPLSISSTEIRRHLARGKSVRELLPESVFRYIRRHRLYSASHEQVP